MYLRLSEDCLSRDAAAYFKQLAHVHQERLTYNPKTADRVCFTQDLLVRVWTLCSDTLIVTIRCYTLFVILSWLACTEDHHHATMLSLHVTTPHLYNFLLLPR